MTQSPFAADRAHHLRVLDALVLVGDRRSEVVDVIAAAVGRGEAMRQLRSQFALDAVQAQAILDLQLHLLTQDRRRAIHEERELLRAVRDADAPAVRLRGEALSPTHLRASHEERLYEVIESEPGSAIERFVDVVREQIARPTLADVFVDFTGPVAPDGPERIHISPTGEARFLYPGDEASGLSR